MKVIIAPDTYKGSISSIGVAEAMERAVRRVFLNADITNIPIADGGEGTVDAFLAGMNGRAVYQDVTGPLGELVRAKFAVVEKDTAVVEMAQASGLFLVPEKLRDPMKTTTFGTGELIKHALDLGVKKIILALGGSATNDGGVGMAQALGAHFYDESGKELGFGSGDISKLVTVDLQPMIALLENVEVVIASDVNNTLCGTEGASVTYGRQKGADDKMIEVMDRNLKHLAEKLLEATSVDVSQLPGSGAAGGIAAPLFSIGKGVQRSGIDIVLDMMQFDRHLVGTVMVLTGEGRIDAQTLYGKVLAGIGKRCKAKKVPVLAFAGSVGSGTKKLEDIGINAVFSITNGPVSLEYAMEHAEELIEWSVYQVMKAVEKI